MFGRKQYKRRYTSLPFVLFRTFLSLMVFAVMLSGLYSAYKSFSGMDPLKLDPKAVLNTVLDSNTLQKLGGGFIPASVLSKISGSVAGQSKSAVDLTAIIQPSQAPANPNRKPNFSFLLVADSHSQNDLLQKALQQAKSQNPDLKFIIGLGDYTEVGTVDELKKVKMTLDPIGIRYFLVPGDHDFWDARDKQKGARENFNSIFGPTYQAFTYQGVRFILMDNADNYLGFLDDQLKWLNDELILDKQAQDIKELLVFIHEPLYHPSSDHAMGFENPKLKDQAKNVAKLLKDNGVKEVFAGDIHFFTRYTSPDNLNMTTIGAVTDQKNPQTPRYAVVKIYDDLSYDVKDLEIK